MKRTVLANLGVLVKPGFTTGLATQFDCRTAKATLLWALYNPLILMSNMKGVMVLRDRAPLPFVS